MTQRTVRRVLPAACVLALVVLASCARAAPSGAPGPSASGDADGTTSTPVPPGGNTGVSPPMHPVMVPITPGMLQVRAIPWIKSVASGDGRTLTLSFWGSVCLGVDHVQIDESPARVIATLYVGTPPSKVGQVCPDLALLNGVRVDLSEPLGTRSVVDGTPQA